MLVLSVERKNFERSFGRIVDFEGTFDVLEIRIDDQPLSEREQSLLEQLHTPFCLLYLYYSLITVYCQSDCCKKTTLLFNY